MIRGSIEVAQRKRLAGWIHSNAETLREKPILAFIGNRCVGAGTIERFRQDLYEAGLGDGYCGFDFALNLEDDDPLGAVIVRLQGSDAALIQSTTRLLGPEDNEATGPDLGAIPPATVVWMQDRGMLEQPEYDFLRGIQTLGAYERGLRAPRRSAAELSAMAKPETVVQELLALFSLGDVAVQSTRVSSISDLAGEGSAMRQGKISVCAIWSEERGRIALDERSHVGDATGLGQILNTAPLGGIDYHFGPDRLLFLHRDCSFAPAGPAPSNGLVIYTASPRAAGPAIRRIRAA